MRRGAVNADKVLTCSCEPSYVLTLPVSVVLRWLPRVNAASEPNTVIFGLSYSHSPSPGSCRSDI